MIRKTEGNLEKPEDFGIFWVVHIHTEREGSDSTINLAMAQAQHDRDPSTVIVENLMQYSGDLNNLGDIAFSRRTVQRKRCHFKVYVNDYWGVPKGTYHDDERQQETSATRTRSRTQIYAFIRLLRSGI